MKLLKKIEWQKHRVLLLKAIEGDNSASLELIHLLSRPAYSLAWRMLANQADAQDVVQEAFIKLWKYGTQFTGSSALSTYFYTIVSRECLNFLSEKSRYVQDNDIEEEEFSRDVNIENLAYPKEDIKKALDTLSTKQRMAMILWVYHDYTAQEIGKIMNMNKNSVDQLLLRAKVKLKKILTYDEGL